jgi:hypothetical protein
MEYSNTVKILEQHPLLTKRARGVAIRNFCCLQIYLLKKKDFINCQTDAVGGGSNVSGGGSLVGVSEDGEVVSDGGGCE